jgi:hypothetical protein
MRPDLRMGAVAMAAMAIAGCASAPMRLPFDGRGPPEIVRVVIAEPPPLVRLRVITAAPKTLGTATIYLGYAGMALLPFLLVAGADEAYKTDEITQLAARRLPDLREAFVGTLASHLADAGFEVDRRKVERGAAGSLDEPNWLTDDRWGAAADAVLDVAVLEAGFDTPAPTGPLLPFFGVSVRLVDTRTHAVRYREVIVAGAGRPGEHTQVPIDGNARAFDGFADLMAHADLAIGTLRAAARRAALEIARDLHPR